ncbi:MAG TPA: helix-turn-helix transcriptional regulator [Solirubrobacteraceae bacterium]|nr:helix-turn-helix transcriptional regulator [Solirubrobacteraceae bacterium]
MLSGRDLLLLARRTAGISQAELAARLGRPRSTIARWELGEMQPPYDAVIAAVAACGLSASVELTQDDPSYLYAIGEQLRLAPIERLRRLGADARVGAVERLADGDEDVIVLGDAAGALQGWPLMLPADDTVEVCARDPSRLSEAALSDGVIVTPRPAGTCGYTDLRRAAERIQIGEREILVADLLDLVRVELARHRGVQAGALEAVLEHRRRWPDGPPERRRYSDEDAHAAIESWLTHSTKTASR